MIHILGLSLSFHHINIISFIDKINESNLVIFKSTQEFTKTLKKINLFNLFLYLYKVE